MVTVLILCDLSHHFDHCADLNESEDLNESGSQASSADSDVFMLSEDEEPDNRPDACRYA